MQKNGLAAEVEVIATKDGGTQLSVKTSNGYDVVADFDENKVLSSLVLFPSQNYLSVSSTKKLVILPRGLNPTGQGCVQRKDGTPLRFDESSAISEALTAFGGKSHKYGDELRNLYGQVSGGTFTFIDYGRTTSTEAPHVWQSYSIDAGLTTYPTTESTIPTTTTQPDTITTTTTQPQTTTTIPQETTTTTSNIPWTTTTTTAPEITTTDPEPPSDLFLPPFH